MGVITEYWRQRRVKQMKDKGSDVFLWSRQLLQAQTTDTVRGSALPPASLYDCCNHKVYTSVGSVLSFCYSALSQ